MTAVLDRLDRRPPRCQDHPATRTAGCKHCQRYEAWSKRARRRAIAAGTWEPIRPVADAAAHLRQLTDVHGWTLVQLGARTGYVADVLGDIRRGRRTRGIQDHTRAAIFAVPLGPPPATRYVTAVGAHRRIRAMCRHGWTLGHIAALYGAAHDTVRDILARDHITPATHARIVDVYRQLAVTPGPSVYGRARAAAAKPDHPRGWPGPMCWTPDTIDDPTAGPDWGDAPAAFRPSRCRAAECPILQLRDRRRRLDPAAVEQCLLGMRRADQLSTAERIDVVTRLARRGMNDSEIAARTRWRSTSPAAPTHGITSFRRFHGIPAGQPVSTEWAA